MGFLQKVCSMAQVGRWIHVEPGLISPADHGAALLGQASASGKLKKQRGLANNSCTEIYNKT